MISIYTLLPLIKLILTGEGITTTNHHLVLA